jgi:hypothetical protein
VTATTKGTVQLVTNNFKIKTKNHGIIYTYKVDFIEGGPGTEIINRGAEDVAMNVETEELKTNSG